MNEYSVKLTEPKRKRFRRDVTPKQTFPVPITSLTGIDASDDTWRWYNATVVGSEVQVSDSDAVRMLSNLGFFGDLRKDGVVPAKMVAIEDFDPVMPEMSGENGFDEPHDDVESCSEESEADNNAETAKTVKKKSSWKSIKMNECFLILSHYDAFFLAYGLGCLRVAKDDVYMSIDNLWNFFYAYDNNFRRLYAAYHHFRAKNWIVRDGTKFGNDFLLYKDGPPFYHASYSVRVQDGISGMNWTELSALNRVSESAAKELMIVEVVEDVHKLKEKVTAPEYLNAVDVREVLVKRWVASQIRDDAPSDV